jgi:hypothetical protein
MHSIDNSETQNGPLSSPLATIFRGKLCNVILRNRSVTTFEKDRVIYQLTRRGWPSKNLVRNVRESLLDSYRTANDRSVGGALIPTVYYPSLGANDFAQYPPG